MYILLVVGIVGDCVMGLFEIPEEEFERINSLLDEIDAALTRIESSVRGLEDRVTAIEDVLNEIPELPPDEEPPDEEPEIPGPVAGIWLSTEEIMALPTEGKAWEQVFEAANSSWGKADLADNNSQHDVKTLAGALVAVRLEDANMRNKVVEGLRSAMQSGLSRSLELSRGLQSYVIAADLIGYTESDFKEWLAEVVVAGIPDHSAPGDSGLYGTAMYSATNWGAHARASLAAAAIYLDRDDWKEDVVNAQKEMIGLPVPDPKFKYDNTTWHADPDNKAGINRKGSTINGVSVSGVLPEDWRRGGEFKWPPTKSGYMHEGLQGLVVTAVILHRAGLLPFDAGDNAIVRALNMVYGLGEASQNDPVFKFPVSGDDMWIPYVVNYYAGTDFETAIGPPGKGMGYTAWTHGQ